MCLPNNKNQYLIIKKVFFTYFKVFYPLFYPLQKRYSVVILPIYLIFDFWEIPCILSNLVNYELLRTVIKTERESEKVRPEWTGTEGNVRSKWKKVIFSPTFSPTSKMLIKSTNFLRLSKENKRANSFNPLKFVL